ncbi:MAG TPA: hypothetical protein VK400_17285, partial [Pyrinomonadaceae bacterium]|nr:hypothetical protein [Pyrinomonadaceae bacterium]
MKSLLTAALVTALISTNLSAQITNGQTNSAKELVGLWEAKRRFGPDIRGTLFFRQANGAWQAEISGYIAPAKTVGDAVSFELPDEKGAFRGKFEARRTKIVGYWIQQRTVESGLRYASPVTLTKSGGSEWRGNVAPIEDTQTFYLMVKARDDGSVGAFLRNKERNLGWTQWRADHLERDGNIVKLLAANKGSEKGRVLVEGRYDAGWRRLSVYLANRGGNFDFRKVSDGESSDFYARGRPEPAPYVYALPPALDDGWQTAAPEDVGVSRAGIEKFIRAVIDTPIDSVNAQEDHGILIARRGKLVLEEYFHGENREKPHDTRSASKSVASDLLGAAIHAGVSVSPSSFVYQVMNGGEFPPNLEPRKRALTVEHLLTMSSGFDCDDNNPESPGFEDNMWEQTEQP